MATHLLVDFAQSQKARLRFIDFRLCFLATLNRNDLIRRFGIKEAAATRDIAAYRELRPDNAEYHSNAKSYFKSKNFNPLFQYDAREALRTLSTGIGDDAVVEQRAILPSETPIPLTNPDPSILASVTNAISLQKSVKIQYHSIKSGDSTKNIVPFTLVYNGLRWHVRAYDRQRERFGDFVLTRITKAELTEIDPLEHELRQSDNQWNRIVDLDLVPHPRLQNKKPLELDYQMSDGVRRVNIRAAVAGYLLRLWNVDCSRDHSITDPAFHLWLKNTLTLYGVDNLILAPGYQEIEDQ